jgi:hypothetical protein
MPVDIKAALLMQAEAEGVRSNFDATNQEIADYVLPRQNVFFGDKTQGDRRTSKIFESTAPIALERFAATVENLLTPRTQLWHSIKSVSKDLNRIPAVARYFEDVRDILFEYRYATAANYATQQHETYMSLGAFGTGTLYVGADKELRGLCYKSVHPSEMYFFENYVGRITRAHRKFKIKARNFKGQFKKIPDVVQKALTAGRTEEEYTVLHIVRPREDEDTHTKLAYSSIYLLMDGADKGSEIELSGYMSFPYAISRYVTAPNEIYGRSPAWTVLSDIKTVNQMRKVTLRSAHKSADPAILTTDDNWMDSSPGKVNQGMLDMQGRPMAQPFNSGARVDFAIESENLVRGTIKDAFLSTIYEVLKDRPQMTATEVLAFTQQHGVLTSPTMGRQQSEALGVQIPREIEILDGYGAFPPPPPELVNAGFKIEYDSPLSRAQRAEYALGIQRTYEFAATYIAPSDPTVFDEFDHRTNLQIFGESQGMPMRGFRKKEDVDASKNARAKSQQMQNTVASAPEIASAIKDISQAQKLQREAAG